MQEIKQADVMNFLEKFCADHTLTSDLKDVFDYFERNKHKPNFFKLFEDYLEEYTDTYIKDSIVEKKTKPVDYEYVVLFEDGKMVNRLSNDTNTDIKENALKKSNGNNNCKVGFECKNNYLFKTNHINVVEEDYEFLGIDLELTAKCTNERINLFTHLFMKYSEILNLNIELSPFINVNEEETHILGRIYTDSEMNINESNIILEGSKTYNSGNVAQLLNLNDKKNLCFFPNQILAIKGKKEIDQFSIKYFVHNIYAGLPTILGKTIDEALLMKYFNEEELQLDKINRIITEQDVHAVSQLYDGDNIHVMICNGYIYSNNDYNDNLNNFLKMVNDKIPHVVIILGPFLYISNFSQRMQKFGDAHIIYEDMLKNIINTASKEHLEKTQFYIVPSVFDNISMYSIPQPPFKYKHNLENVHFLSNPSFIYINDVKIVVTSCDPIYNFGKNLLCRPLEGKLFFLFEQILRQLSLFPCHPSEINVDITQLNNLLFSPNRLPEIFLFPSWTGEQPYVKEVHKKLFICCYSLDVSKANPPNCYSNMYILPPKQDVPLSKRIVLENIFISQKNLHQTE